MYKSHSRHRVIAICLGIVALVWAALAYADPSARVARLGYTSGAVSFSPAGEDSWVQATRNRPLITGDHLWVDAGARAELQIGSAAIQLNGSTSATLLNLDDSVAQLQLAQGTFNVRVRRLDPNDVFEIDTPNLAFSIREPGDYRIDVDADGNSTIVTVRSGRAEVYGEDSAYTIYERQSYRFFGNDLRDYDRYASLPSPDDFDRWCYDRNRRGDNSMSARYVSRDVIGYEDLDDYGSWRDDPSYGHVWVPSNVSIGWAPYNYGHWVWINPWGWTWIDDAPWGFTVSHYGRWAHIRESWCWVPGPIVARPVYAPALVVFVGGSNFQLSLSFGRGGGIGWFPLGPREIYRPAYPVSRNYFTTINTSNTVVNNVNITNVYNNTNVTNVTYVNRQVPGAVVAVPATAFVKSQPVARSKVEVSKEAIRTAPVSEVAAVAPAQESVRGAAPAGRKPPAKAMERPVVAKTAPPPKPASFAAQQPALAANPGKPLDEATLATVKPSAPVPAAPVKVVGPQRSRDADKPQAAPTAPPQIQSTPAPSPDRRGQPEPRKQRDQIVEPKPVAPPGAEKPAEQAPASPTIIAPERGPAAGPPIDRETKQPPQTGRPERRQPPDTARPAEQAPESPAIIAPERAPAARPSVDREIKQPPQTGRPERRQPPDTVRPAEPAPAPATIAPERAPVARPPTDRDIREAPPPQTGRPERRQPPDTVRPAEPAPAPTTIAPERAPAARPPTDRDIREAPPPQTRRPERRQPADTVRPVEQAPSPPPMIAPERAPAARPPVDRDIRQASPPPQPYTGNPAPKPEALKGGEQKTKEQLKREEESKKREMENKRLQQ